MQPHISWLPTLKAIIGTDYVSRVCMCLVGIPLHNLVMRIYVSCMTDGNTNSQKIIMKPCYLERICIEHERATFKLIALYIDS